MTAYERFQKVLKREFHPLLRAEGFKGSGTTLRRMAGERIDVVNVQGSQWGGRCYVNLGVHFTFIPDSCGKQVDPAKLLEFQCVFRTRMEHPPTPKKPVECSDWAYGEDDAAAERSVRDMADLFRKSGSAYFQCFEPFPEALTRITPAAIGNGDYQKLSPFKHYGQEIVALFLARVMKHLGRVSKCRAFAKAGLRHAEFPDTKVELEKLLTEPSTRTITTSLRRSR